MVRHSNAIVPPILVDVQAADGLAKEGAASQVAAAYMTIAVCQLHAMTLTQCGCRHVTAQQCT